MKNLTDQELLKEIKRQWREFDTFEWERMNEMDADQAFSPASDYLSMQIEEHISDLETEYRNRGRELPDREEYVSQFRPTVGDD